MAEIEMGDAGGTIEMDVDGLEDGVTPPGLESSKSGEDGNAGKHGEGDDKGDGGEKGGGSGKGDDGPSRAEMRAMQRQFEQLQADLREERAVNRGLLEKLATGGKRDENGARKSAAELEDDSGSLIEEIAKGGSKVLAKKGFVRADDVERMVADKASKIVEERLEQEREDLKKHTQVLSDYPALRDESSVFTRVVAELAKDMVTIDPRLKGNTAVLAAAAKAAERILGEGSGKTGGRAATGMTREQRIAAQSGDRGRPSGGGSEGGGGALTRTQMQVMAGFGLEEKKFREHLTPRSSARKAS